MKLVYQQRIEIRSIENSPHQQVVRVFILDGGTPREHVAYEGTPADCERFTRALIDGMGGSERWKETM